MSGALSLHPIHPSFLSCRMMKLVWHAAQHQCRREPSFPIAMPGQITDRNLRGILTQLDCHCAAPPCLVSAHATFVYQWLGKKELFFFPPTSCAKKNLSTRSSDLQKHMPHHIQSKLVCTIHTIKRF